MVKTSTARRGLRLGRLSLSLTGSYLGYQVQRLFLGEEARQEHEQRFHRETSRRLRDELGSLKGAVMKLGQLLSLQTHALPAAAIEELAQLQMAAPGMHPTLARAQFKGSLGRYPEDVFAEFDAEPFAAASLGQVHRAVTRDGARVAVKIQYPAIRNAIENDLKLLRSATFPARLSGHAPAAVIEEVKRGFLEETDYLHEGRNMELFARGLCSFKFLSIPEVHWDVTTDRVLTMSFVEGEVLDNFLKRRPPQSIRDLIGTRLVELFYFQLHRLRVLHADHHPGNYLFSADGSIGLVDFGCAKRLSVDLSEVIRCAYGRTWRQGEEQARHVLQLVFGQNVPYRRARRMLPILEEMADALSLEGSRPGFRVDFGQAEPLKVLGKALRKALRERAINPEFAFVSRTELGLYSLLHRLGARVDVNGAWKRVAGK